MKSQSAIADIEVTMVESHANLKIRSKRRPKQLLKVVSALHSMRLTVLHLNVSTVDQIVLYSLSVKVEDDCKLSSVDEIATAVYQMLGRIQEESMLNC
nr:unknown [Populus trichocarpa]